MTKVTGSESEGAGVETKGNRDDVRDRILDACIALLKKGGRDAVTTRAAAQAAGVQAPALYRLFNDKTGLLDAVAEHGFAAYLEGKKIRSHTADPVADLRAGWKLHIEFGLANPDIYLLMYADPRAGTKTPAAARSYRMLQEHFHRVAVAGRLRVSKERAANLFHAAAAGTVLALLAMPEGKRDMKLSGLACEAVLTAVTTAQTKAPHDASGATAAVMLRAVLPSSTVLTEGERGLMSEWLDRLVASQS